MPTDDMGHPQNITDMLFAQVAQTLGKTEAEVKELCFAYLGGESVDPKVSETFEKMFADAAQAMGQPVEEAKKETQKLLGVVLKK